MYLDNIRNKTKEKQIIYLFITIIIISQGIRTIFNNLMRTSIFNYDLIPIMLIIIQVFYKRNKLDKNNIIFILLITGLLIISFIYNGYSFTQFLRSIFGFILPLYILLINYKDIDIKYTFPKLIKIFNIYIIINILFQIIFSIEDGRTGGIIGHPLTAGWYYAMYISFNCIYSKYFKPKGDIFIIKDIAIALLGTVLASGRISMIIVLVLAIIYVVSCCKYKSISYIIIPIAIILFLRSSLVNEYIWQKFVFAASYGDITNGRLLGFRKMILLNIHPNIFTGMGIGYSNYLSIVLFKTVNFENPMLMFAFDYGILTVVFLIIIILIRPVIIFFRKRNFLILANFILIFIIPFTYNGLAESIGIFIVLIFTIYMFLALNNSINI